MTLYEHHNPQPNPPEGKTPMLFAPSGIRIKTLPSVWTADQTLSKRGQLTPFVTASRTTGDLPPVVREKTEVRRRPLLLEPMTDLDKMERKAKLLKKVRNIDLSPEMVLNYSIPKIAFTPRDNTYQTILTH